MFEFLFGVFLGLILGVILLCKIANLVLKNLEKDLREPPKAQAQDQIIPVKVERHENTFYLFDFRDDKFLAQGATASEIVKHLRSRFPNQHSLSLAIVDDGQEITEQLSQLLSQRPVSDSTTVP